MEGFASLMKNSWMPLIFTSLIFGLLHIYNPEVDKLGHGILIYYIGTGLFLGVLSIMDQGIELSIGFHAANNLVTALLVTSTWTVFQTESILIDVSEPSLFFETVFSLLILYPLFLNPQENVCMRFHNNLNTRLLERDNFVPKVPCLKEK